MQSHRAFQRLVVGIIAFVAMLTPAATANAQPSTTAPTAKLANQTVTISTTISPALRDCYHPSKQPYPKTACTFRFYVPTGTTVNLVCQYSGEKIGDDYYWDYIEVPGRGYGYVTDEYVNTGVTSPPYRDYNVPLCSY
jgi:hypothetical protein